MVMDLHAHTFYSDGLDAPDALVHMAYENGVRMLALTDHDSISGRSLFLETAAQYYDFTPIVGVELSTNNEPRWIDILALDIKNFEVYKKYEQALKRGAPSLKEVVGFALDLGAVPVLAHPVHTGFYGNALEDFLLRLKEYGLQGLECFHPDHLKEQANDYIALARKHDLLITCGSDFHGQGVRGRFLGYFGEGYDAGLPELEQTEQFFLNRQKKVD